MNKRQVKELLLLLNSKAERETSSGWLVGSCPFASFTHGGGVDRNPSFGIKYGDLMESAYNCFSCGESGDSALDLVLTLSAKCQQKPEFKTSFDFKEALILVEKYDVDPMPEFETIPPYGSRVKKRKYKVLPESWLYSFAPAINCKEARIYLKSRGVRKAAAIFANVRYDFSRKMVCIPIRTKDDFLVNMVGRSIEGKRHHMYQGKNTSVLLGEDKVEWDKPLVVLEGGVIDYLKMVFVYKNVVSLTGVFKDLSALIDGYQLYSFFDNDKAGDMARRKFERLDGFVAHLIPPYKNMDVGDMSYKDIAASLDSVFID
jgi:hypothetical protein